MGLGLWVSWPRPLSLFAAVCYSNALQKSFVDLTLHRSLHGGR